MRRRAENVSISRARELLVYDPETGELRWNVDRTCGRGRVQVHAGDVAGCKSGNYIVVGIDGTLYQAHRLAWCISYGYWPDEIDHANGVGSDNRLDNLRDANRSFNLANTRRRSDNVSGYKGVSWDSRNRKWRAEITKNGKRKSLGRFLTASDAHIAYCEAAKEAFGEFARVA